MDVTFYETKSLYMYPQVQGKSSFEAESFESLESSFVPFIQEPSHSDTTLVLLWQGKEQHNNQKYQSV